MDLTKLSKKINLNEKQPPIKLEFEDLISRPLTREDLEEDLKAVNSSIEIIQKTRGGSWPSKELTEDADFLDLAWHEREFKDKNSLAYVVYDKNSRYIGCFYLYPIGVRTELNSETEIFDVDASWWVSSAVYEEGYYNKLFSALDYWLNNYFPFKNIYYSNKLMPRLGK